MRFLGTLWLTLLTLGATAQAVEYSTPRPRVEDVNDPEVVISRVDLTAQYTVIYMRFRDSSDEQPRRKPLQIPGLPYPIPDRLDPGGGHTIHFVPTARLYANSGARSFKFIRADNIPTTKRRSVQPGETVDFVAYFERLDPGIEVFDLFECSDRNRPGEICFNFWGVHITNPLKRSRKTPPPQPRTPPPAPLPAKPKPAPSPVPVPAPDPTLAITGTVRDAKTGKPVAALLTYRLLSGAESNGGDLDSTRAKAADGNYRIAGDALTVWDVNVAAKGYFSQRDTIAIARAEKTANFDLAPIAVGTKITLQNIYFAQSKYELQAESYPELNKLVEVMKANPQVQIRLEGHTDIIGDFDANLDLSRNRVNAVKRYLNSKGIAETRVEAVGYGHSRPINSTRGTPHPENRRVEMVITKA